MVLPDHDLRLDNHLPLRLHATRLLHEPRICTDVAVSMVDYGAQTGRVDGDSLLHTQEEGEPGLVSTYLPSQQYVGDHVDWGEVCWR